MLKQIRFAMQNNSNFELFQAVVEIDETYLGGKPRTKGKGKRGRGTNKTAILGIYDRASGRVIAHKMETEDGKTLTGKQLLQAIDRKVAPNATYFTDEFTAYRILDKLKRKHQVVNHSQTYVAEDGTNTNTIECFWSLVKRMHYGTYHKMSAKYLDLYMAEEAFRFSYRKNMDEIFDTVLKQAVIAG